MPWGVPSARYEGGRGACLGGVRVCEGWPRRVLSGPRAYLHTGLYCTRDYTYIAPRYGGCGRVGTVLVTLKGRATYGMQERLR